MTCDRARLLSWPKLEVEAEVEAEAEEADRKREVAGQWTFAGKAEASLVEEELRLVLRYARRLALQRESGRPFVGRKLVLPPPSVAP